LKATENPSVNDMLLAQAKQYLADANTMPEKDATGEMIQNYREEKQAEKIRQLHAANRRESSAPGNNARPTMFIEIWSDSTTDDVMLTRCEEYIAKHSEGLGFFSLEGMCAPRDPTYTWVRLTKPEDCAVRSLLFACVHDIPPHNMHMLMRIARRNVAKAVFESDLRVAEAELLRFLLEDIGKEAVQESCEFIRINHIIAKSKAGLSFVSCFFPEIGELMSLAEFRRHQTEKERQIEYNNKYGLLAAFARIHKLNVLVKSIEKLETGLPDRFIECFPIDEWQEGWNRLAKLIDEKNPNRWIVRYVLFWPVFSDDAPYDTTGSARQIRQSDDRHLAMIKQVAAVMQAPLFAEIKIKRLLGVCGCDDHLAMASATITCLFPCTDEHVIWWRNIILEGFCQAEVDNLR